MSSTESAVADLTESRGFLLESRLPFLGPEWDPCRMHGETPVGGFTEREAARIGSSLIQTISPEGPEVQIRIINPQGEELALESNKNKKA